jgi:hypothetical protein
MPDEPSNNDNAENDDSGDSGDDDDDWSLETAPRRLGHELMVLMDRFAWYARETGAPEAIAATHILNALLKSRSKGHEALKVPHRWARGVLELDEKGDGTTLFSRWTFPVTTRDGRYTSGLAPAFDAVVPVVRNCANLGHFGPLEEQGGWVAMALMNRLPGRFAWLPDGASSEDLARLIRPVLEAHRGESPEQITEALFTFVLERGGLDEKAIESALRFLLMRESRDKGKP